MFRGPLDFLSIGLVLAGAGWIGAGSDLIGDFPRLIIGVALGTVGWGLAIVRMGRSEAPAGSPPDPARRSREGRDLCVVLAVSLVARAFVILPDVPLSDDLYRYLWDGRVQNAGTNPFVHAPSSPDLASLRDDEVWPRINHPDVSTIYPPTAQFFFRALDAAGGSVRSPRIAGALCDLLTILALATMLRRRGRPGALAAVYGWCPLAVIETAGGGHVDALGVALFVTALAILDRLDRLGPALLVGFLLGLSALVKPMTPLAVPALLLASSGRVRGALLLGGALAMLSLLPYLSAGGQLLSGFLTYAEHWRANDAVYSPLVGAGVAPRTARWLLAGLSVGAACLVPLRYADPARGIGIVFGITLLLSPTVHPWYALWLVPMLPFARGAAGVALIGLVALLPIVYVTPWVHARTGVWAEPAWLTSTLWGVPLVAALTVAWRRRARAGSATRR